jgi:class 3 adenylate cyclase
MAENEPTNRRLAAILAADVAGYSPMMAIDEAGTWRHSNITARRSSIQL